MISNVSTSVPQAPKSTVLVIVYVPAVLAARSISPVPVLTNTKPAVDE